MTLRLDLERVPTGKEIVRHRTRGELVPPRTYSELRGRRVCLHLEDVAVAVTAMAVLDGQASVMFLAPASMDASLVARLAASMSCEVIWSSHPLEPYPGLTVVDTVASLARVAAGLPEPGSQTSVTRWVLATSGTTGEPKLVSHTLASLTRTTKADQERGATARWGLMYEYARFAGLQVLLQSVLGGSTLLVPETRSTLPEQIEYLVTERCTHLSATPTQWRSILMTPGSETIPLRQITLGGEIADERVLRSLRSRYPRARISHVYASTEAGVGFSVTDGRPGFPVSYLVSPHDGVEIEVREGSLWVRNAQVQPFYLSTDVSFADERGWVDTGDAVEISGDRVRFLGRANGVINVGGNKVHPEQVEGVLLRHPHVVEARVYGVPNPITGALVCADVCIRSEPGDAATVDVTGVERSLRSWCAELLERHQVPVSIRIVEGIGTSSAGKLERLA